jgi:hypothetical protein
MDINLLPAVENPDNLFLSCPFAQNYSSLIHLIIPLGPFEMLISFRNQLNVSFFMDIIILMSWSI